MASRTVRGAAAADGAASQPSPEATAIDRGRSWHWRRAFAATALGLLVVALLVVVTQWLWLAALLASALPGPQHREVRVARASIGLTPALEPVIRIRGLHVGNAPWADRSRPLVDAADVVAVVSWSSLWAERRIIRLLVLRDATVDLERQADGLRNWRLSDPDNRSPGRYRILALQADRSKLRFLHGGVAFELNATSAANPENVRQQNGTPLPVRYGFDGQWRGVAFTAQADGPTELTFYDTGRTFPLRAHVETGGAGIDLDGRAGDILRDPTLDATLSVTGRSLAAFAPFIGDRGHEARGFRIDGQLSLAPRRYRLSEAKASFGKSDFAGQATLVRGDADRLDLDADLRSDSVDVADLLWLRGLPSAAGRGTTSEAPPASAFSRLQQGDGRLRYKVRQLHAAAWPMLHSLGFAVELRQGQLRVADIDVGIGGGAVAGKADLDTTQATAAAAVDLHWHDLRVEQLLPAQKDAGRITGKLRGQSRLVAHGDSIEAMRNSVSGEFTASLHDGSIASRLDAMMGLEGGNLLKAMATGGRPLALSCATLRAQIAAGAATLQRLVVDSEETRTTGSGRVDFARGTLDVVLTPQAKHGGLLTLQRSIHLSGPLEKPQKSLLPAPVSASTQACS